MRDASSFEALCRASHPSDGGIGTLREKTLHRVLKNWIEPRTCCREQPFSGFVVDILNEDGVTEIQTRGFFALRRKLEVLLSQTQVRVIFPLPAQRWIRWADPETGELSPRRLSPRRGDFFDAFYELMHVAPLLGHPQLTVELLLIDAEELRLCNGWGKGGKRGATRIELLPSRWPVNASCTPHRTMPRCCPPDCRILLPAPRCGPRQGEAKPSAAGRSIRWRGPVRLNGWKNRACVALRPYCALRRDGRMW